jgi:hypothetical protein
LPVNKIHEYQPFRVVSPIAAIKRQLSVIRRHFWPKPGIGRAFA